MKIILDGREVEAEPGRDLLSTCLENGVEVPHLCWHGDLGSVGACRLCAVKVFDGPEDTVGRIEMSCMTPVKEGQRVEVADREALRFRAHVIEWLMVNHPHDCAVCEEGGACHLQDMTVATGHHARRAQVEKRVHRNQDLGPLLTHEMNRCIACYRCVRFYRDHAGGRDLDVFGAHDRVYFGRVEDGVLDSPFAGNLAEVCPTGVFTDRWASRHYARRWDMNASPSICGHCSVGCNITLFERHGNLRQVQNRPHGALNGSFLCDRGRFGPLAAESPSRLTTPRLNGAEIPQADAMAAARALLSGAIGIGSPRASLEANFALRRLVGPERFFAGVSDAEAALVRQMAAILRAGPARIASVKDIETADAALVLGDLTGIAPRAALALRQAARGAEISLAAEKGVPRWMDAAVRVAGEGRRSPVTLVTPLPDALDDIATTALRRDAQGFGLAVAAALQGHTAESAAQATARALAGAAAPVILAGWEAGAVMAAAAVAGALGPQARIGLFPPEANSLGLALLGGAGLESALAALATPAPVIVLESDLGRAPEPLVAALRATATQVLLLDWLDTGVPADLVLPVAAPSESTGTFVNYEGRAQRFFAGRPSDLPPSWRVLTQLGGFAEDTLDSLLAVLAAAEPALAPVVEAAPPAGMGRVARATVRFSGRTASDEAGRIAPAVPPAEADSALVWSMEGDGTPPPALRTGNLRAGLHSASAAYGAVERIGGPLKGGDPGVRLLVPGSGAAPAFHEARMAGAGLTVLALHDPFSATEIDRASPLLAERAPGPRLRLHPEDAAALGLVEGAQVAVDGAPFPARLTLDPAMPLGHVGLSRARAFAPRVRLEALT